MFASNTSQVSGDAVFVEDVFQNWLYTGNGSTQTITNGIDLSTYGGLTWLKRRDAVSSQMWYDSARGIQNVLFSNGTSQQFANTAGTEVTSFNTNGFGLGPNYNSSPNTSGGTYVSWTFRKQPKFFDVVTYTGNNAARTIAHSLGSAPGCIIIKPIDSAVQNNWVVYHQSLGNTSCAFLNLTDAASSGVGSYWNSTTPTSTVFSLGTANATNQTGINYVAYLFAHNAGGFGLTGTDNVISCGSFTTDSGGNASVNLGYEPQWILIRQSDGPAEWMIIDNMRGWTTPTGFKYLAADTSGAEASWASGKLPPNATGFSGSYPPLNGAANYIYIAIRRGPMKTPTSGTSVFSPVARAGTGNASGVAGTVSNITTPGFVVDSVIAGAREAWGGGTWDRLRGTGRYVVTNATQGESNNTSTLTAFDSMSGFGVGSDSSTLINYNAYNYINYAFRRAPGFFDEVCWTGDGTGNARNHNLAVYPELVISKLRSGGAGFGAWNVQNNINPSAKQTGFLNTAAAFSSSGATSPTANVFYPTDDQSGATYVTYLFASCPGVSKVGSYTGNGSTQTIDCGFTGGARFVLIKSTNVSGDWWVFDTARGITSTSDAGLMLNTTGAEIVDEFGIEPASVGFAVKQTGGTLNNSGTNYIFLAIA